MLTGGNRITCMIQDMFPGLDLYYTDPAQHIITAGYGLDDLYHDLPTCGCFGILGVLMWSRRAIARDATFCEQSGSVAALCIAPRTVQYRTALHCTAVRYSTELVSSGRSQHQPSLTELLHYFSVVDIHRVSHISWKHPQERTRSLSLLGATATQAQADG